jgi:hypothetical protein
MFILPCQAIKLSSRFKLEIHRNICIRPLLAAILLIFIYHLWQKFFRAYNAYILPVMFYFCYIGVWILLLIEDSLNSEGANHRRLASPRCQVQVSLYFSCWLCRPILFRQAKITNNLEDWHEIGKIAKSWSKNDGELSIFLLWSFGHFVFCFGITFHHSMKYVFSLSL